MPIFHTVRPGDCLLGLAERYGFDGWERLYQDAGNDGLRERRAHPPLVAPGDVVAIPDRAPRTLAVASGQAYKVQLKRPRAHARLAVAVAAKTRVELALGDQALDEQADAKAPLEAPLPAEVKVGRLTLHFADELGERPLELEVAVGELHAAESVHGLQARLSNLGHYFGPVDGVPSTRTRAAVARFQAAAGLQVTGEADAATIDQLRQAHDAP